ncbi:hypothetical protein K6Q96_21750 [Grimontia kaedaensis]|uniref:Uncharacterized protein n=1 Tax=Grimontia kaedaensis TaxID=2872157 RepID=A0ABY4WZG1_9GAMM|nr:hypothetical protein [Grimontia kaedaensis]USH04364.1 hypothetical protein K6Q96_21750 [Grimontia kaedaensis]
MIELYDVWVPSVFWIIASCLLLVVLIVPFYKWNKRKNVLIILCSIVAFSSLSFFVLEHLQEKKIKNEISDLISEDSVVAEIYEEFDNELFLKALKNQRFVHTNKTRPLEKMSIHIVNAKGEVKLQVAQDSKYPYLYWVYYPKYQYSSVNELGKVRVKMIE